MYVFGFIFFFLALLVPSLALPIATYRPGEVTNSTTTPGTTIVHGRCGVHITHYMTGPWDPEAHFGKVKGYILDNDHNEIGKMSNRWYGIWDKYDIEFHSRLDGVLYIDGGATMGFFLGQDKWNSTDERCSVGGWKRYEYFGKKWWYPTREMDCGFAC
ncbi:hypothetical protein MMC30_006477 [Trapelia coarctata]|nr:hypothetical protein [Trapelia coarctata]